MIPVDDEMRAEKHSLPISTHRCDFSHFNEDLASIKCFETYAFLFLKITDLSSCKHAAKYCCIMLLQYR